MDQDASSRKRQRWLNAKEYLVELCKCTDRITTCNCHFSSKDTSNAEWLTAKDKGSTGVLTNGRSRTPQWMARAVDSCSECKESGKILIQKFRNDAGLAELPFPLHQNSLNAQRGHIRCIRHVQRLYNYLMLDSGSQKWRCHGVIECN
jgi:hypothetical protein